MASLKPSLSSQWSLIWNFIQDFFCINFVWLCSLREMSQTKLMQMKSRLKLRTRLEGLGSSVHSSHDRKSEKTREVFFSQKPSLYCMISKHICTCAVLERLHPKEMVGMKLCLKNSYNPPAPTNSFCSSLATYLLSYKLFCFSRKPNEAMKKIAQLHQRFLEGVD